MAVTEGRPGPGKGNQAPELAVFQPLHVTPGLIGRSVSAGTAAFRASPMAPSRGFPIWFAQSFASGDISNHASCGIWGTHPTHWSPVVGRKLICSSPAPVPDYLHMRRGTATLRIPTPPSFAHAQRRCHAANSYASFVFPIFMF